MLLLTYASTNFKSIFSRKLKTCNCEAFFILKITEPWEIKFQRYLYHHLGRVYPLEIKSYFSGADKFYVVPSQKSDFKAFTSTK